MLGAPKPALKGWHISQEGRAHVEVLVEQVVQDAPLQVPVQGCGQHEPAGRGAVNMPPVSGFLSGLEVSSGTCTARSQCMQKEIVAHGHHDLSILATFLRQCPGRH